MTAQRTESMKGSHLYFQNWQKNSNNPGGADNICGF